VHILRLAAVFILLYLYKNKVDHKNATLEGEHCTSPILLFLVNIYDLKYLITYGYKLFSEYLEKNVKITSCKMYYF